MRKSVLTLLASAALLCAALVTTPFAFAAGPTVSQTVHVSFTPPTTTTDGSAISGALTYNVYGATSATGTWAKVDSGATASPVSFTAPAGDTCFAVTAVEQDNGSPVESAPSPATCLTIPGAPTGVTVTVSITIT